MNFKSKGSVFTKSGGNFLKTIFVDETIEFASILVGLYIFSFTAYLVQTIMIKFNMHVFGRAIMHVVQHVVMIAMVVGVTYYTVNFRGYNVSLVFRYAIGCEILVIYMKMVSYLGTNHYLWTLSRLQKDHEGSGSHDGSGDETGATPKRSLSKIFGRKSVVKAYQLLSREQIEKLTHQEVCSLLVNRGIDVERFDQHIDGHVVPESPRASEPAARKLLTDLVELDEFRRTAYPGNITFWNFVEYTILPVVVYEPKYPRTSHVNWANVVERLVGCFGCILFMWAMIENFVIPRIMDLNRNSGEIADVMMDMMIPLQLFVIGIFYVTFECILGANAELARLADREFYADWWNSTSFEEFSRKWNKPVHEFLLRHVHMETQVTLGLSRGVSTIVTFIYSIIAHEILLLNTVGIFRPYLAFLSLFQIPLWPLMRSHLFTNRLLGNIFFWASLMIAWPLMTVLYCRDYCKEDPRNCRIDL